MVKYKINFSGIYIIDADSEEEAAMEFASLCDSIGIDLDEYDIVN